MTSPRSDSAPDPANTFGNAFVQRRTFYDGSLFLNAFLRVRVQGKEHLPATGPFLLAANHISHFDPPLLTLAAGRWIDWVAMVELYRHRWMAAYLRALASIPLDRSRLDRAAVAAVLRHLRAGRPVGIFPEGGIRTGEESVVSGAPLNNGACRLAVAARVPLVPAVILGSEQLYSPRGWLFPRRAFEVRVMFGEALNAPGSTNGPGKAVAEDFNARLAGTLRALARLG